MNRSVRVVLVTAGLLAAGAAFGALAGVVAIVVGLALTQGFASAFHPTVLAFVGLAGALCGGVLFPAAAWLLMRRVPLGLAVLGSVVGTALGGVIGWVLADMALVPVWPALLGAVLGFVAACVLLRQRYAHGAPRPVGPRAA
jgi:MFS family permease